MGLYSALQRILLALVLPSGIAVAAPPSGDYTVLETMELFDSEGRAIRNIRSGELIDLLPRSKDSVSQEIPGYLRVKDPRGNTGYVKSMHLLLRLAPTKSLGHRPQSNSAGVTLKEVKFLNYTGPRIFGSLPQCETSKAPDPIGDGCTEKLKRLPGSDLRWNYARADQLVANCEPPEVKILMRNYVDGGSGKACRNTKIDQPTSETGSWASCPLVRECTPEETAELHENLAKWRKYETGRCEEPPPKKTASKKGVVVRRVRPTPKRIAPCLEPFEAGTVHRSLAIHHTAGPSTHGPAVLRDSHVVGRGWAETGYHFQLAQDAKGVWQVYEGRPLKYKSAHGGPGLSDDSISIVIAGNYSPESEGPGRPMTPEVQPPPEAVLKLMGLVAKLKKDHPQLEAIRGHDEHRHFHRYCTTVCPGPGCQHLVQRLRGRFFANDGGRK